MRAVSERAQWNFGCALTDPGICDEQNRSNPEEAGRPSFALARARNRPSTILIATPIGLSSLFTMQNVFSARESNWKNRLRPVCRMNVAVPTIPSQAKKRFRKVWPDPGSDLTTRKDNDGNKE
jgi:hypothetical protein